MDYDDRIDLLNEVDEWNKWEQNKGNENTDQ